MTIREAIEAALQFIETKHGHKQGALYEDLLVALNDLQDGACLDDRLTK